MLPDALRPVWAEINMEHAAFNVRQILKHVSASEVIGIIKADAYGHGAVPYAKMLLANGVTQFGVAALSEAITLRQGGITSPVIMLGLTPDMYLETVLDYEITPVISTYRNAQALSGLIESRLSRQSAEQVYPVGGPAKQASPIAPKEIFVALDTGMGRVGFPADESGLTAIERISKLPHLKIQALFSHFACADEADKTSAQKQLDRFQFIYESLRDRGVMIPVRTIANSAGIIDLPASHFEAVRPGIILYGCYPSGEVNQNILPLKPVMNIKANITLIKTVPAGTPISYGSIFQTKHESIIATLPLGYADGYPRFLTEKARVIVRGQYAPVVGKICMDQCMIDVTDVPGVREGDEVILMGSDGRLSISAEEWGEKTHTINYEILSRIGLRIPRVYV